LLRRLVSRRIERVGEGEVDMKPEPDVAGQETWHGISRRTMLKAGWSVPVILSVAPAVAFAASGSPPNTNTTVTTTPSGGSTPTTPSTTQTPHSSKSTPGSTGKPSSGSGGSIPQQEQQGPQPARISRGFTG
jgi:hypothetical protein